MNKNGISDCIKTFFTTYICEYQKKIIEYFWDICKNDRMLKVVHVDNFKRNKESVNFAHKQLKSIYVGSYKFTGME